jgi:hypothetical protein
MPQKIRWCGCEIYLYKIKSNYVMIEKPFISRFQPVCENVYSRIMANFDDILYDLTLAAALDVVIKMNQKLYLSILPKDIIEIIKKYL